MLWHDKVELIVTVITLEPSRHVPNLRGFMGRDIEEIKNFGCAVQFRESPSSRRKQRRLRMTGKAPLLAQTAREKWGTLESGRQLKCQRNGWPSPNSGDYAATVACWTAFAAVRITSRTRSGWESIGTWLLSSSRGQNQDPRRCHPAYDEGENSEHNQRRDLPSTWAAKRNR